MGKNLHYQLALTISTEVTLHKGHPVFNQVIPEDRVESSCLFSQLVPLQLVANIPGKAPVILWDNEVISTLCLAN